MSTEPEKEIINLRADLAAERAAHAQTEGKLIDYKHLAEHANTKREQAEAQLAAANASLNIKAGQIIQLWHERDAALDRVKLLRGMLAIAKCPECDGSGVRQISETEAVQCQWCDERKLALSAAPPPAAKVTP